MPSTRGRFGSPELIFPAGLIILACIGTYWNSLGGPFIWQDQAAILNNETIRQLSPISHALVPPRGTVVAGRPLVNLSFALNYAIGGTAITGYHLVNITIHLLSALVLFGIVRRTLGTIGVPALWSEDVLALGSALLWMVHPIQSEAVNYISARIESLAGLFFFLTLYCAIRARRRGSGDEGKWKMWNLASAGFWATASVLFCALGVAANHSVLLAPLVVFLYDRAVFFRSLEETLSKRRFLYAALALTWLGWVALTFVTGRPPTGLSEGVSVWRYALHQPLVLARYLWLIVWPQGLVLDYGIPGPVSIGRLLPAALLALGLWALTAIAWRVWPRVGFLAVAFFLTLAPSLFPFSPLTEVGAERYLYVPLAAMSVLAVTLASVLTQEIVFRFPVRSKSIVTWAIDLAFVVILACAVRTVYRSEVYADPVALWTSTVAERPHGRAHYTLATALIAAGAEDEGISELRKAVRDVPEAKHALANELYAIGKMDEAERVLSDYIRERPLDRDRIPSRLLLARTLMAQGKLEDAAREFQAVLDLPGRSGASAGDSTPANEARDGLKELGVAQRIIAADLLRRDRIDEAVGRAREAVRLVPQDSSAYAMLGSALAAQGKFAEAIVQFREALRIDPGDQQAQSGLAAALDHPVVRK